jgi:hypothetical protein
VRAQDARKDNSANSADKTTSLENPSSAFFERYCYACHAVAEPKGDFRVDRLSQDFADKNNREQWLNVAEQLKIGTMPPKGKPLPAADNVKALTDWIDIQVTAAQAARNVLQGRAVMRRLNSRSIFGFSAATVFFFAIRVSLGEWFKGEL